MSKLFVAGVLLAGWCGGSPPPPGPNGKDPRDVTGNYDLAYDNKLLVQVNLGGAIRSVTQTGYGGITDFGTYNGMPVQIDLSQFCARTDVTCPSEQFWVKTAIDQPKLEQNGFNLQELQIIDNENPNPPAGKKAPAVAGLVDHGNDDRFLVGLGFQAGATQNCAAIDVSFATGRFSHDGEVVNTITPWHYENHTACDPDAGTMMVSDAGSADAGPLRVCARHTHTTIIYDAGAEVDGIKDGKVGFAWAGGCAFGPILAGATLYLETGYTGNRTGEFDPPPFTPAPVTQPDGGFPDGGSADGG
jgi:hypothetical protein